MRFVLAISTVFLAVHFAYGQDAATRLANYFQGNQKAFSQQSPYMKACLQAVAENKRMHIFIGKDAVHVPGAISGRISNDELFPDVKGPAVVIAEPDGEGWLKVMEVRRDRAPNSFRVEERTVQQFTPQPAFRPQFFRGGGRSSGSC